MNPDRTPRDPRQVPDDWDQLRAPSDQPTEIAEPEKVERSVAQMPAITMIGASWGDLAALLGLCAAALLALKTGGYGAPFAALPWAAALALTWWGGASSLLIVIRLGTPGMLMAGLAFERPIPPLRLPLVLLTELVLSATLGIPAAVGRPGWPLSLASGVPVGPAVRNDDGSQIRPFGA